MVKVIYKNNDNGSELGSIEFSGLSEVLIPDFKLEKHAVFLRHIFESKADILLWKIASLDVGDKVIEISLDEQISPSSLGTFARAQRKKPATLLRSNQFQLVEVEFGFQQDIFDGANRKRNEVACVALMPGELHKKRPCIIIHCEDEKAQILPLTTKGDDRHPKQMPISSNSFNGLSDRYTKNDSHLLLSMMQTVSVFRIFPMKNNRGNYSNDYSRNKLCNQDKDSLLKLLALNYAKQTLDELGNTRIQLDKVKQEKARLLDNLTKQKESNTELTVSSEDYWDYLTKLARYVDIKFDDAKTLKDEIDALT